MKNVALDNSFYFHIMKHLNYLLKHSKSLIQDVTSNTVESFNSNKKTTKYILKMISLHQLNKISARDYP